MNNLKREFSSEFLVMETLYFLLIDLIDEKKSFID